MKAFQIKAKIVDELRTGQAGGQQRTPLPKIRIESLLVFSDRPGRWIAVQTSRRAANGFEVFRARLEELLRLHCPAPTAHWLTDAKPGEIATLFVPPSNVYLATFGPCWYTPLRRPIPIRLMSRARLDLLSVYIDSRIERHDEEIALNVGLDMLALWEAWALAIRDENATRTFYGEPSDPVLDPDFERHDPNVPVYTHGSDEPLHVGCSAASFNATRLGDDGAGPFGRMIPVVEDEYVEIARLRSQGLVSFEFAPDGSIPRTEDNLVEMDRFRNFMATNRW